MVTKPPETGPLSIGNAPLAEKFVILLMFSLLLGGVYYVLKPFGIALMFGCILAIAAWPVRTWLLRMGLSGTAAALLMLAALLLFVLVPIFVSAPGLVVEVRRLVEVASAWVASSPPLPRWIAEFPLVGDSLAKWWDGLLHQTPEAKAMLLSYAEPVRKFVTDAAVGLASSVLHIAIGVVVATSFWAGGSALVDVLRDSLRRLGGDKLAGVTDVAGGAVRGVFYGIIGTAAVQGLLMALGLWLAGVPAAASLGFVTLILAVSQFGGVLINFVWGGAAWWIYSTSGTDLAFWFVIVWGLMVTFIDNLLKPWLIGSSMKLPLMLVILGVFGGFISFGFLGLFIGPTLLAVAYDLLAHWRGMDNATPPKAPA